MKEMSPGFLSLYLLLVISTPLVLCLGFQPNGGSWVSDGGNVSGDLGVLEFKRFKVLLGSSPAPPLQPSSHGRHKPSAHNQRGSSETKVSVALTITILVAIVGIVLVIFSIFLVLACKRCRALRKRSKIPRAPSTTRSRVSSNPCKELYRVNSVAPFKRDDSFKQSYGNKTMSLKDSMSLLSGELVPVDSPQSDEESLFSIGESNSPFHVSNSSLSPSCRVTRFTAPKPPISPFHPPSSFQRSPQSCSLMASPSSNNSLCSKPVPPPPLPPLKPPPSHRGSKSSHPLPPPPCHRQPCSVVGKDVGPLPKLKPLHWDKVRGTSDQVMVWDRIRFNSFEFDEEMIETLFGYNPQSSVRDRELKSKSLAISDHFMESKRLQNITILIKTLNATSEHVCDALMKGSGLSVQQLEALARMTPTKEEEEKLFNYKEDASRLGSTEIFLKQLLKIPFSFLRIEAMLFKETFDDEASLIRQAFAMIEGACKELKSSRLFLRLLEAVLKAGNRMNVGTIRGGAKAFKLDALLKLADVKGIDGKTTLLHFVVQEIIRSEGGCYAVEINSEKSGHNVMSRIAEEKEEDCNIIGLNLVSGFSTELCNVRKTASVDLNVLAWSISNLKAGVDKLKSLLVDDSSTNDGNETFFCCMKSFLNHAQEILTELKNNEQAILQHVKELTEYYHGDLNKNETNPLRIFMIISDFLGMLDRVCKEL